MREENRYFLNPSDTDDEIQNDEIEKLALERSSIYRKCRLEEIRLPLLAGNLRNVPMEEVGDIALIPTELQGRLLHLS